MHTTHKQWWTRRLLFQAVALVSVALVPGSLLGASGNGVEVKPFGLLDVDASFAARYLLDEQDRGSTSGGSNFEKRSTWEEEFLLVTRSYVYHPGFLNIDFNIGPKLVQQEFDSTAGYNDNDETFLNFLTRLNFLDLKNYPFSIYYRRDNPSVTTGLSGRFLAENNEYGFDARISGEGKSSVKLNLVHRDTEGSGFGTIVDEELDRGSVRLDKSYRDGDSIAFEHSQEIRESSSGSPGLPIQHSRITQDNSTIIARNFFGSNNKYSLNQTFYRLKQDSELPQSSELESQRYTAATQLQHSEVFRSFLDYQFSETKRTGSNAKSQVMSAKMDYSASDNFRYGFRVNHSTMQQIGFDRDRSGIEGNFTYSKPTRFGSISLGGSLAQARTDQESVAETIQVFDESLILNGTTPVDLGNEFILATSVVVSNATRTQVFVEGIDYRLIIVGGTISVQRLLGGNILDGQTVLVDYEFQTSGTAEFDTLTSALSATASFLQYANVQVSYNTRETDVSSGSLTTPVNDQDVLEMAIGADYPVGKRWTLGAEFRHTDQDEDISPSVRDMFSVYASATLRWSMNLHLSGSLVQVDQERSTEDIDQTQYRLGIGGRVWSRVQFSYDMSYLRDTGGSLRREQLQHRLNVQWQYRQVRFFLRAALSEETLGLTERQYTRVTAEVQRAF